MFFCLCYPLRSPVLRLRLWVWAHQYNIEQSFPCWLSSRCHYNIQRLRYRQFWATMALNFSTNCLWSSVVLRLCTLGTQKLDENVCLVQSIQQPAFVHLTRISLGLVVEHFPYEGYTAGFFVTWLKYGVFCHHLRIHGFSCDIFIKIIIMWNNFDSLRQYFVIISELW